MNSKTFTEQMIIAGLLLLAIWLRIQGIDWGLPNKFHPVFSYHPDEGYLVNWAEGLYQGKVIIKHFIYGGTFYYSYLHVVHLLGEWVTSLVGGSLLGNTILLGRIINLVLSLLTLVLCYRIGTLLYNRKVGIIALGLLAIFPAHVFWVSRLRPDELFTFLVVLNLYVAMLIWRQLESSRLLVIGAALLLGLTVATRFPAGLLVVVYLFVIAKTNGAPTLWQKLFMDRRVWMAVPLSCIGYVIASPHTLIYFEQMMDGLSAQWEYQRIAPFVDSIDRGPIWFQQFGRILAQSVGIYIYPVVVAGVGYALFRRNEQEKFLFCWLVPYGFALSLASWTVVRYAMPILPVLAILAAVLIYKLLFTKDFRIKALSVSVGIMMLIAAIAADVAYAKALAATDPRDMAVEYLMKQAAPGSTVGEFMEYPEDFYSSPPPSNKYKCIYFTMNSNDDLYTFLQKEGLDYIIIPDAIISDAARLGEKLPSKNHLILYKWSLDHEGYVKIATFSKNVTFLGIDFERQFSAYDYRTALPKMTIYKRVNMGH